MTTKYGSSKLALACASFLAFAGLTAFVGARAPAITDASATEDAPVVRRVVVEDGARTVVPAVRQPVARSRGS